MALTYLFLIKGLDPSHHTGTAIITAHQTQEGRHMCDPQGTDFTVFLDLVFSSIHSLKIRIILNETKLPIYRDYEEQKNMVSNTTSIQSENPGCGRRNILVSLIIVTSRRKYRGIGIYKLKEIKRHIKGITKYAPSLDLKPSNKNKNKTQDN